ncbi:sensor histidine kinase [Haliscomenobacter sp.]|uniref:sensor histidine kinase n=1 Tax=Haliscomenobacter sp. TaxID=2717303 RepID=UPI003BAA3593
MNLRIKYFLLILVLHGVIIYLAFRVLYENKVVFIASELLVLVSLYFSYAIFRDVHRPFQYILSGIEAIRDQDFSITFRPTGNREVDELIAVYNSMIEQLRVERTQLAEQHYFLEKLIKASPIAILILDFDDHLSEINPKAQDLLGLSPLDQSWHNRPLATLAHPLTPHLIPLKNGDHQTIAINGIETYKVQRSFFMDRGFQRPFIMVEELSEELLASEKKAYGKVIRMMAHEVNNTVGAINSIIDSTKRYLIKQEENQFSAALAVAYSRNERLNLFMRRFADVVRLPQPQLEYRDFNGVLQDAITLHQPLFVEKGVQLSFTSSPLPVRIKVDVQQMEQVLINILKNALEACIAGQQVEVVLAANSLNIRNNGAPIPKDHEHLLFTPFFSNKTEGQGIGLTLIRDILMGHGWKFSLRMEEDGWTWFRIWWG